MRRYAYNIVISSWYLYMTCEKSLWSAPTLLLLIFLWYECMCVDAAYDTTFNLIICVTADRRVSPCVSARQTEFKNIVKLSSCLCYSKREIKFNATGYGIFVFSNSNFFGAHSQNSQWACAHRGVFLSLPNRYIIIYKINYKVYRNIMNLFPRSGAVTYYSTYCFFVTNEILLNMLILCLTSYRQCGHTQFPYIYDGTSNVWTLPLLVDFNLWFGDLYDNLINILRQIAPFSRLLMWHNSNYSSRWTIRMMEKRGPPKNVTIWQIVLKPFIDCEHTICSHNYIAAIGLISWFRKIIHNSMQSHNKIWVWKRNTT